MKLIVGLGNPGAKYAATRHNVGFMVIDRLVSKHLLDGPRNRFHADTYQGLFDSETVMLLKPQTFMNRSGLAVGEAARFFKVEPHDVLIIVDDVALPAGAIRMRGSGGVGGHNGLADIQQALGTANYPRLRVGVDEPRINGRRVNQADYVLSPFHDEQRPAIASAVDEAAAASFCWATEGPGQAMNRFNTPNPKPKKSTTNASKPNQESRSESPDEGGSQTTERTENP
ncbi:MAG: aminoacyl-tRNA hydrolase [Phycisphaeraceae bacterium]